MNDLRTAAQQALEALENLWQIIDDIDTYGDMAKADDKLYRSLVERRQRTRFEETGISTDGYTLNGGAITALRAALAQQDEPLNLRDPAVQKRLATQWGYVPAALAEPVQEPVAWNWMLDGQPYGQAYYGRPPDADIVKTLRLLEDRSVRLLYAAPPQRKLVPLTEEEIHHATGHCGVSKYAAINITRTVERAHGIKE